MNEDTVVLAQLQVQDCTAELYLNGVPVSRIAPPKHHIENVAVEQLLVPGLNTLEVVVEPGPQPSLARSGHRELTFREMKATGRLIRFQEGVAGKVENGKLLGETTWAWVGGNPERKMFPVEVGTQIDMGPAHGRWAWQDAPEIYLDESTIDEACTLMDEVDMVLSRGHSDGFWRLTELQLKDVQRAYPAVTESVLRADLAGIMDHHDGAPEIIPRSRDDHDFRLVGGGRLLELLDRDYSTSFKLREPGDGSPIPYRILLARIDGKLRIVR